MICVYGALFFDVFRNVPVTVDVHMCDDLESEVNQLYSPGRGAEFEALAAGTVGVVVLLRCVRLCVCS